MHRAHLITFKTKAYLQCVPTANSMVARSQAANTLPVMLAGIAG